MTSNPCERHEPRDAWCGERPSLQCEFDHLKSLADSGASIHSAWVDLHHSHAYVCPDESILQMLISECPIVEVGAGTGYWARLIGDRGGDIVAIDKEPPPNTWREVIEGDERLLDDKQERTLLMVRPYNGQSEAVVGRWNGSRMIVVQQGPFPNPHNGMDGRLIDLMSGRWRLVETQKLWDPIDDGFLAHTFVRCS